jgi:hypothetical protein
MKRADEREMDTVHPDWERLSLPARPAHCPNFVDQPAIAAIYAISGVLMETLGPMFWAALIVLFIQAQLFKN